MNIEINNLGLFTLLHKKKIRIIKKFYRTHTLPGKYYFLMFFISSIIDYEMQFLPSFFDILTKEKTLVQSVQKDFCYLNRTKILEGYASFLVFFDDKTQGLLSRVSSTLHNWDL